MSRHRGALDLDHPPGDGRPSHPEHRGGRCHSGGARAESLRDALRDHATAMAARYQAPP